MMAKMRMAKETRRPICIRGARALKMDFKTTCKPEIIEKAIKNYGKINISKLLNFFFV
jgi:hypothetical protein